jgi:hypothetical protein
MASGIASMKHFEKNSWQFSGHDVMAQRQG